jgi:hypothetical protein
MLEETGRRFGPPKPYEELQDEFRTRVENQLQEETSSAATPMEVARIGEILIGQEAAERFASRPRRQRLRSL